MRALKRVLCLAVCMTMVFACLTGCGKKNFEGTVRVASLKGPTSMGLLELMEESEKGNTDLQYDFQMYTGADEILPQMIQGQIDIALIPSNAAANLYQKTSGGVEVIDINTLGVLYMVTADDSISSVEDLKGKTIVLTGQGTTPDLVLTYILEQKGIFDDVTLDFRSEATEVVSVLAEDTSAIGLLPQPFVTAACIQNESLKVVFDMNALWDEVNPDCSIVTGVTVVRKAFAEENPDVVKAFLEDHKKSVDFVNGNPDEAAAFAVKREIVAKEPIAKKAIPNCSIVSITGDEMKKALKGYLEVIYEKNPAFIGGSLPEEDFYY
ncbi:MAG: ABC transporter substrate-binding protein [Lachnospiraceae bacterium]|nr:ABC transporter substrate-binding protein [Lachnospiraceae bacterium]